MDGGGSVFGVLIEWLVEGWEFCIDGVGWKE